MWKEQTYLSTIKNHLTENLMLVKDEFMNLSESQLNKKPAEKKWSIAQCLDHVIKLDKLYMNEAEKAIAQQNYESRGKMYHPSLTGRFFINIMKPEGKRKIKTFKIFGPRNGKIRKAIIEDFEQHQSELMALVINSDGLDLSRIKVRSPATSMLKFRLGDVFSMLALHQRRHINQAMTLKEGMKDQSTGSNGNDADHHRGKDQ